MSFSAEDYARAIDTVLTSCLALKPGEELVVVTDPGRRSIGETLHRGALERGAEATLLVMPERAVDGQEPPAAVAAALQAAPVFLGPTTRSFSHTRARKAASDAGARGATLPHVTEDILARLMACDFPLMQRRSRAVADLLTASDSARVTCPRGTDLAVDLSGRTGIADDGDLSQPGAFGNLPCGEGFIAPLSGAGTAVVATIAGVARGEGFSTLTVENGRLVAADGAGGKQLLATLQSSGELGTNLAEFAAGTNERAQLIDNVMEDEKILGTVHIAFGASAGIGGTVSVPVHLDCVILEPTLDIGGTRVLEAGEFVLR